MVKKKVKMFYKYDCNMTGESYKTTAKAPNESDLVSVRGYYQLNIDKDDRPEYIKKQTEVDWANERERQKRLEEERRLAQLAAQSKKHD